jgi:NCAIR mutase (PurE)-related protein
LRRWILRRILENLVKGAISIEKAEELLKVITIKKVADLARIDINRDFRKGIPEVILAEGKKTKDLKDITLKMFNVKGVAIVSRASKEQIDFIKKSIPKETSIKIYERSGLISVKNKKFKIEKTGGKIGILTAGTSDIPIAEEASVIAEEMGCEVVNAYDVGVAGIHRLFPILEDFIKQDIDVLIVAAGREGALPSVIAGMIDVPIIAVPTSIGYGLGGKGVSALIAMLQACSLGIAVVNIDGGVAAGAIAALIANRVAKFKKTTLS